MTHLDPTFNTFPENADALTAKLSEALSAHPPSIIQLDARPYLLWILPLTPAPDPAEAVTPGKTLENTLESEAELRNAVIDRLIAASLSESKPAWEATLERWRTLGTRNAEPDRPKPKAG